MEIEANFAGKIVKGTCCTMCPQKEMEMREREGLLYHFEVKSSPRNSKTKRPQADPSRVVKQYARPAAGRIENDPIDLRPAPVLKRTMIYLLDEVASKFLESWSEAYAFVFDRIRAVRQDMVIQGIIGKDAVEIFEQAVRFHAYASYRLRHANVAEFDPVINKHHLLECLKRLLFLYQTTEGPHPNRAEFEAVYLLDSLGDEIAMIHYLDLSPELRNYLQILSHGYSVKNCRFPVDKLVQLLHSPTNRDVTDLCSECGLIDLFDQDQSDVIHFNKAKFHRPSKEKPIPYLQSLDKILELTPLSEILLGSSIAFRDSSYEGDTVVKQTCKDTKQDVIQTLECQFDQCVLQEKNGAEQGCSQLHSEESESTKGSRNLHGYFSQGDGENVMRGGVSLSTQGRVQGRGRGRGRGKQRDSQIN